MSTKTQLCAGMKAPDFVAQTWDGQPVSLAKLRGKPLWLAFYRHVNCPLCNIRIHEMRDRYAGQSSSNLHIVAVFQSPASRFEGSQAQGHSWYPMVSDPGEVLYGLYGLGCDLAGTLSLGNLPLWAKAIAQKAGSFTKVDGSITRIPADFLIQSDGTIADAFYGKKIGDHIPFARVDAFRAAQGL